jgi:hypothetical protein
MKKSTTLTYNIETANGVSTYELEYKDYVKNEKGEENLLHYKNKATNNEAAEATEAAEAAFINKIEVNETFNKIKIGDDRIDETIGISSNNNEWKIHEYKNHVLDKEYKQGYDTIKFDINCDILEKCEKKNYIKDNI